MEYRENDEITLKDIVVFFADLRRITWQKKYRIILLSVFITLTVESICYLSPAKYQADAKLLLKENVIGNNSFLNSVMSNVGNFGGFSGGLGEDAFINIAKTKSVLKKTLLKKVEFRGKSDLLSNHFLEHLSWKEAWKENVALSQFEFKNVNAENFTFLEDSIFNCLYYFLSDEIAIWSDNGGVINISVELANDTLAKKINEAWVHEMIDYFKQKSNSSLELDIKFQDQAIDSLQNIIAEKEVYLTQLRDEHNAIVKAKAYLDQIRLKRQIEINTVLLTEMIKNHEMCKYAYMTQKPIVEVVELPRLPLEKLNASLKSVGIVSFIIGLLISALIFVLFPYVKSNYIDLD